MKQVSFGVSLRLRSPFLIASAQKFDLSHDVSAARVDNHWDKMPYVPRETIRGLMRHAAEEWFSDPRCTTISIELENGDEFNFSENTKDEWFGLAGREQARSRLAVEDLVLTTPDVNLNSVTRSATSPITDAPIENATFTVEQTHRRGVIATFEGRIRLRFVNAPPDRIFAVLRALLECIPAVGVGKSVGWGEVVDFSLSGTPDLTDFSPDGFLPEEPDSDRYRVNIFPTNPFLVFSETDWRPDARDNVLTGKDYIPGHVIFGAVAELVAISRDRELAQLLPHLTFQHAFPRRCRINAYAAEPMSWVSEFERNGIISRRDEARGVDAVNSDGLMLTMLPSRILRNHTSIKAGDLSPEPEEFFSRSLVNPAGFEWCGEVRLKSSGDRRQFGRLIQWLSNVGLPSFGETAVAATLEFHAHASQYSLVEPGDVEIVLVSDCRMLPDNAKGDLSDAYQAFFATFVGPGCKVLDHQGTVTRVEEGAARFIQRRAALLTTAGSWFHLNLDDPAAVKLSEFLRTNLPHCDPNMDFGATRFLPENGYGSFRIVS